MSLFFTLNSNKRQELELEYENERLNEVHGLFTAGRSANVDFAGYVTDQTGTEWQVSGIMVFISPKTRLPAQPVIVGATIRVHGQVQNGGVVAVQIELLPSGYQVPDVNENESDFDQEVPEGQSSPVEETTGTGSENEAINAEVTATSTPESETEIMSLDGTATSTQESETEIMPLDGTATPENGGADVVDNGNDSSTNDNSVIDNSNDISGNNNDGSIDNGGNSAENENDSNNNSTNNLNEDDN